MITETTMKRICVVQATLFFCCCGLFLSGCESNIVQRVPISGTISVNGEKLERGVVSFTSVDDPSIVEGATVENGVFECELLTGKKRVRCSGSKIVGTYAPDPLFPDQLEDKLEEVPASVFEQEIKINVKRTGDYFVIQYGNEPTSENEESIKESSDGVEPSGDRSFRDVLPEL